MAGQRSWSRLTVEALVIVFSILLALFLDEAWEEISDRTLEGELIERLADEAGENLRSLEDVISENRRFNAVALMMGNMDPESLRSLSDDSLQTLSEGVSQRGIFVPLEAESASMIQSGDFQLIQNREVRTKLMRWTQALDVAEGHAPYVLAKINERLEIHTASGFYLARSQDSEDGAGGWSATRTVMAQEIP